MDIIYRFNPNAPLVREAVHSNEEVLKRLSEGNHRFANMIERMQSSCGQSSEAPPIVIPINPLTLGVPFISGLAPSHAPYALVLGCADARVPIEHVLDCAANELFVVRVAGNVLGLECLGSVDYAVGNLKDSLQSVIVLAHTECGAVTAAVDVYLSPSDFGDLAFSHAVRSLIDRILLAVRGSARALDRHLGSNSHQHPQYREWLIQTAVYMNAAVTACDLQREVTSIVGSSLSVSYTVYDMALTRISPLPSNHTTDFLSEPSFATAPTNSEEFIEIANQVVKRILSTASSDLAAS